LGNCSPRSFEQIDAADLERLGRAADSELELFFSDNPHLEEWRDRVSVVALAQGGAEHALRGERGVWDLDLIVCFASLGTPRPYLRRRPRAWDWGPSKFGRCPFDPPSYTGRAVDIMLWVIPDMPDPAEALSTWLASRLRKKPDPNRARDLAHEPVILIRPNEWLGEVVWDPGMSPPAKQATDKVRRSPAGLVPP
jgi:hypothetical protein